MNGRNYRRGEVVWPILLVTIGTILLLNNFGITDWNLWELALQLWPALLLAAGVDLLIPRRSVWGTALAVVLVAGVFAGSLYLLANVDQRPIDGVSVAETVGQADEAFVLLAPGVGELKLDGEASDGLVVDGIVEPLRDERILVTSDLQAGVVNVEIRQDLDNGVNFWLPGRRGVWHLSLASSLPLRVQTDVGVGLQDLDLAGTMLDRANISFGVGTVEVTLPVGRDVVIEIDGGIGDVVLRVPAGSGLQLNVGDGLQAVTVGAGFARDGDFVRSTGTSTGGMITGSVDLGIGAIHIVEQPG